MTEGNTNTSKGNKYDSFIRGIQGGRDFEHLRVLQGAVEHKARISESYIKKTEYAEIFEIGTSKKQAKEAREQLIKEIVEALNAEKTFRGEEMLTDHYSRLFHALAVLKVKKDAEFIIKESDNNMYNTAYTLWLIDDGSKEIGRTIMRACWFMSEEIKERSNKQ